MKITFLTLFSIIFFCGIVFHCSAYEFQWEIDETPEGQESATIVEPVQVTILDEQVEISSHSASLWLMIRYSVHLGTEWSGANAYKLLQTFESIPQERNYPQVRKNPISLWKLSDRHIQDDIEIEFQGDSKVVTISKEAFTYSQPFIAKIEGVRGRYFSKRLHHAVVRFVTDGGANRYAIKRILRERFDVRIDVPDYTELTRYTTGEHAERFSEFKNEELMGLVSMLEEFPQGMLKIPGLKYIVRRLDGTPHPLYPEAPAVAWPTAGYIEFMESAFKGQGLDYIHRLILHEKAHFLWEHLFDEQLKQDWIELGGWYENPADKDSWSTTKQTEFVSAYAHGINPNEDMAESISFYIVRPDKLRSRAPAKYEFIQNRIMHGTRYISQIREDLTFEVYNLYPDYVYPGRITRINILVEGEPEEDKLISVEIEIHGENVLDAAASAYIRIFSNKDTYFDIQALPPVNADGIQVAGHILRGQKKLSRYAPSGYWAPDKIITWDAHFNDRNEGQTDFGWKLYVDNPLADCEPPEYVPNSMRLSLSKATTSEGKPYQIVTASWEVIEASGIKNVYALLNDNERETFSVSRQTEYGHYDSELNRAVVKFLIPDYMPTGIYSLNNIEMLDVALNVTNIIFTDAESDEPPKTIEVLTKTPDLEPPVLDLNRINIEAEPTIPEAPNGETIVDISFWIKDNISGYEIGFLRLRDPQGIMHPFYHYPKGYSGMYFVGDTTLNKEYNKRIVLPVGSAPGIWGLAEMTVFDKAGNTFRTDFTEIVRFKVDDNTVYAKSDVNEDGVTNILDLVIIAAFDVSNDRADVNDDGTVNILDLVVVASQFGEEGLAAPGVYNATVDQIQSWLTEAINANDGSHTFRRGIYVLQNLLLTILPETTALLPNYPNPFNPETWIPYHLAKPADVTLTIYGLNGAVVRTLALGNQNAGMYQSRNHAAYWDGRNVDGEHVASGVYFYTLTAGEFSATRRMLILK